MSYVPTRFELISIIRRIDTDGDGKLKLQEFTESVKSQFALVNHFGSKPSKAKPTRVFTSVSNLRVSTKQGSSNAHRGDLTPDITPKMSK